MNNPNVLNFRTNRREQKPKGRKQKGTVHALPVKTVERKRIESLPVKRWLDIRPIKDARPTDRFCAARVSGNSLLDDGIFDKDYILVRLTFELSEITPGKLAAVLTPYGLLIKHIYLQLDGRVRLVSSNPIYKDIVLDAADAEIQGIVVRVERDFQ